MDRYKVIIRDEQKNEVWSKCFASYNIAVYRADQFMNKLQASSYIIVDTTINSIVGFNN